MIVTRTTSGHLLFVSESTFEAAARAWEERRTEDDTEFYAVEPDPDSGGFRLVPL